MLEDIDLAGPEILARQKPSGRLLTTCYDSSSGLAASLVRRLQESTVRRRQQRLRDLPVVP